MNLRDAYRRLIPLYLIAGLTLGALSADAADTPSSRLAPEISAGWEGNDALGYGYFGAAVAFRANQLHGYGLRVSASFLNYESHDVTGDSSVRSPGVFLGGFYRRATARTFLSLGAGYEIRHETTTYELGEKKTENRDGAAFQLFWLIQPNERTYATVFTGFSASDSYTWGRASLLHRFKAPGSGRRAWFFGAEVTGHGNDDVVGYQGGLVAELSEVPDRFGSIRFSVGYGHYDYKTAFDENRVYFGVSLYRNLRPRPKS